MAIAFPTGHTHPRMSHGTPGHARPCQCHRPLIDQGTLQCVRCGKHPKAVINETFSERARTIQSRGRARKLRAAS